jgi:hypothetical protein
MSVKVGCASDYNKIHPDRIQKKKDEEAVVLAANKEIWLGGLRRTYYRTGSGHRLV